jgi:site-specific DNA-adenine methylase
MEEAIGSDLNNWLCNAYIEVLKQPNIISFNKIYQKYQVRHLSRTVLQKAYEKVMVLYKPVFIALWLRVLLDYCFNDA